MDDDLKRLIETTAVETRQHFDNFAEEMRKDAGQIGEETRRHFDVVAEGLRRDVQLALEGVTANGERLDRFAADMKLEFAEVRSMIRFSHSELDRRLHALEVVVVELQSRVERLESGSPH